MTIIKKFEPEKQKKSFPKRQIAIVAVAILVLAVMEIWISNMVVTYGEKFEKLSELEQSLNLEKQILENEIAKHASLGSIASKSASYGFSKASSIQYIR